LKKGHSHNSNNSLHNDISNMEPDELVNKFKEKLEHSKIVTREILLKDIDKKRKNKLVNPKKSDLIRQWLLPIEKLKKDDSTEIKSVKRVNPFPVYRAETSTSDYVVNNATEKLVDLSENKYKTNIEKVINSNLYN